MKRYPLISNFDGAKFGARYGLKPIEGKFFVDGDGMLVVPEGLPDDPPIQETCDPRAAPLINRIAAANIQGPIKDILLELAKGR